jgi:hypothetical protein
LDIEHSTLNGHLPMDARRVIEKMLAVPRRFIFLMVAVACMIPILYRLNLPIYVTEETRGVYNEIEALPEGTRVLVAFDYEPVSTPEMEPMATAILRHIFSRRLRVVGVTVITDGIGMGERVLNTMRQEFNLTYGRDYVFLGYRAGSSAFIISMGEDLQRTFEVDNYGAHTQAMPIMQGLRSLRDFAYMVDLHDDGYLDWWVIYGHERYGIKIGAAASAIMATGAYPFLQAHQITGVVGALKGASEYEELIRRPGAAGAGMDAQSIIHIFAIALIVFGNVAYFLVRKLPEKESL